MVKLESKISCKKWSGRNISFIPTQECLEYFPNDVPELIELVKELYSKKMTYHVVSTGMNWGLGSKSVCDENIIINLCNLNSINEINEDFGYAVVGPGVSQEQLYEKLKQSGSSYFIDVTGSSKKSSIIGNSLERGVAYNSLRVEKVIRLEVLLPDGSTFSTGFGELKNIKGNLKDLYSHGIGPDLKGIFFQSNIGIITSATIQLNKIKAHNYSLQFDFKSREALFESFDIFKELLEENILECIPHIPNRERSFKAIAPNIMKAFDQAGKSKTKSETYKLLEKVIPEEWSGIAQISGDKNLCKLKIKIIKKKLKNICKIKSYNTKMFSFIDKVYEFFPKNNYLIMFIAIKDFRNLGLGVPTDAALASVINYEEFLTKGEKLSEIVDDQEVGFSYILPIAPLSNKGGKDLVEVCEDISRKYSLVPAITLNPLNEKIIEAVISFNYLESEYRNLETCLEEMLKEYEKVGIYPYRLPRKSSRFKDHSQLQNNLLKKCSKFIRE